MGGVGGGTRTGGGFSRRNPRTNAIAAAPSPSTLVRPHTTMPSTGIIAKIVSTTKPMANDRVPSIRLSGSSCSNRRDPIQRPTAILPTIHAMTSAPNSTGSAASPITVTASSATTGAVSTMTSSPARNVLNGRSTMIAVADAVARGKSRLMSACTKNTMATIHHTQAMSGTISLPSSNPRVT